MRLATGFGEFDLVLALGIPSLLLIGGTLGAARAAHAFAVVLRLFV